MMLPYAGVLGPIRDGNLSINAAAKAAGEALPHVFTTPFWYISSLSEAAVLY